LELLPETFSLQKPEWLKVRFPSDKAFFSVSQILREKKLNTICQSARCPNMAECWSHSTATFLILGNICSRDCRFCAVDHGTPIPIDEMESFQVAEAVILLELKYAVITSVTRDDLPDGGAGLFVKTIEKIHERSPQTQIEILIPDFNGSTAALQKVIDARPNILNHNLEIPENLYPSINRPIENYRRSLRLLYHSGEQGLVTKSGMMVGLGEKTEDILRTFSDLRNAKCELLTIGQYLQPTKRHAAVQKYYTPLEFKQIKQIALDFGFKEVASGPLVRSSFQAHHLYRSFLEKRI
jgi:lipoic acid synthetase